MINDASVVIGGGNWGIKEADVLGYKLINEEYYARDIDFANSTAAGTYTDSTGVIRKSPYNLAQYSEEFDNAAWVKTGTTITPNTTTAPNGTLTADTMSIADSNSRIVQVTSLGAGTYTISAYVKVLSTTTAGTIRFAPVVDGSNANSFFTPTTEWARYTQTFTAATGVTAIALRGAASGFVGDVAIWGAQLVEGTEALPYFPTTTRLNVPRIDYRNADGSLSTVGRLLIEPQRTNVALQSETITAATGTTVTLDTTTAPTGLNTADKLVEDTSTGLHFTSFGGVLGGTADSSIYCVSIFAKAAGRTRFVLFDNAQVAAGATNFDLSNGTVISGTGRIENYGNGWYRCTIFPAKSTSTTANVQIRMIDAGTNTSYTGDGTSGLFLWGKQIEPSATYPTTYIPTTTAAVTRNADVASKTGVSSWIGQTQGTIFAEINVKKLLGIQSRYILNISDNTANNRIYIGFSGASSNVLRARIFSGGVQQASIDTGTISSLGTYKLAFAYNNNDAVFYVNGVQIGTDTSVTVPACSKLNVCTNQAGASPFDDGINQAAIFTTRLTNSQLQSLTTL